MKKNKLLAALFTMLLLVISSCSNSDDIDTSINITSILPLTANVGDIITINATNIDPNATYIVEFNNGIQGLITEITTTYLKVKIPEKSYTGDVTILHNDATHTAGVVTIVNIYNGDIELLTQTELDAFGSNNYSEVTGIFRIGKNNNTTSDPIKNLDALKALVKLQSEFYIKNNDYLTNIDGLSNVTVVEGNLALEYNNELLNFNGLSNLTSTYGFYIYNNDKLNDISGLNNLTKVEYLYYTGNKSLNSLNGLENLTTIVESLEIHNSALTNIDEFSQITSLEQSLEIVENDYLTNIDGLSGLTTLGEYAEISENKSLANINGFNNLKTIGEEIYFYKNESLTNIDGLSSLIKVEGGLDFNKNYNLSDFCGLTNLFIADDQTNLYTTNNAYNPTEQDIIDGKCSQ